MALPPTDELLKIGDVARRAAVTIDTVRFYEREGLLGRIRRTPAGQRRYDVDSVRRLVFVRRAGELGFSLAEIKSLLNLRVSPRLSCDRVRDRAVDKIADIERRMAELGAMRDALTRLAANCSNRASPSSCPFLDELSQPRATAPPP